MNGSFFFNTVLRNMNVICHTFKINIFNKKHKETI